MARPGAPVLARRVRRGNGESSCAKCRKHKRISRFQACDRALSSAAHFAFVSAISLGVPIVPIVCKGTTGIMPKGKYLSILPGTADLVVLEPIPTAGMTYEDRDRLRDEVRRRIEEELNH